MRLCQVRCSFLALRARVREVLLELGLAALGVLSVLTAIEFLVPRRSLPLDWPNTGIFRLDPQLIFSLRPGAIRTRLLGYSVERVSVNSLGLRDDEVSNGDWAPGRRIIVLGDSYAFGYGVGQAQAFPNVLESLLRESGAVVDVWNAGVPAYGTDQELVLYRDRLQAVPHDVVVLSVYENDVFDNIWHPLFSLEDGQLRPLDPRWDSLYFVARLQQLLPSWVKRTRAAHFGLSLLQHRDVFGHVPKLQPREQVEWSKRKMLLALVALRDLSAGRGGRG